jgi:hypothetical protein
MLNSGLKSIVLKPQGLFPPPFAEVTIHLQRVFKPSAYCMTYYDMINE